MVNFKSMGQKYISIGVSCSLSETPLQQAALLCGPSFSYTLHVTETDRFDAYRLARHAQTKDHPFAPYINVVPDLERTKSICQEWYLVNDTTGASYGSPPL